MDIETMIITYNIALTDAASGILGKECRRKKSWVIKDVLDHCDERRDLKKKQYEAEGAEEYREAKRRIQKAVKQRRTGSCLNKKQQQESISAGENLTSEKQRTSTNQDKSGKCLTEEGNSQLKKKRFSAAEQNIVQNCTTICTCK